MSCQSYNYYQYLNNNIMRSGTLNMVFTAHNHPKTFLLFRVLLSSVWLYLADTVIVVLAAVVSSAVGVYRTCILTVIV